MLNKIIFFIFLCQALGSYGQDSVCGGKLFVDNSAVIDVLQSSAAADCDWVIETHQNRILLLSISNTKNDIYQDFLNIYDGPSDSFPKIFLEQHSTNEAQFSVYSESNSVLVRLHRSSEATAFQLKIGKHNWTSSLQFCYNNSMQLVAIETAVEDLALYNAWGQYQGEYLVGADRPNIGDRLVLVYNFYDFKSDRIFKLTLRRTK